jgi:hypothetical protein
MNLVLKTEISPVIMSLCLFFNDTRFLFNVRQGTLRIDRKLCSQIHTNVISVPPVIQFCLLSVIDRTVETIANIMLYVSLYF